MKRAIIFGGDGQDAHYLSSILQREGIEVHRINHKQCDIGIQGWVFHEITRIMPDYVFHFAAKSSIDHKYAMDNHRAIVDGSFHVLEGVKRYAPHAKVFLSGSILQFKSLVGTTVWTDRDYSSIYAAQRNASVDYARYYRSLGLQVYVGYFSYHDSPRRSAKHLAKRVACEAQDKSNLYRIHIANPEDQKEWNYAGDMMEAVWEQVNGPCFEAVLGSGVKHSVLDYAKACVRKVWGEREAERGAYCRIFTASDEGREPSISFTSDSRFQHCFKTSLDDLAGMIVADCKSAAPQSHIDS